MQATSYFWFHNTFQTMGGRKNAKVLMHLAYPHRLTSVFLYKHGLTVKSLR